MVQLDSTNALPTAKHRINTPINDGIYINRKYNYIGKIFANPIDIGLILCYNG